MHTITFYPLGNADTCLVELESGKKLLFDYAAMRNPDDEKDLRVDLPAQLQAKLKEANRNYLDVVAFTHADDDHIHGSTDFFYLEHDEDCQDKERVIINELWVPAAMIVDTDEDMIEEAKLLREEARYRLKEGKGIRVFSRPGKLEDWLKSQGLKLKDREHLISDAGTLVPDFDAETDGVEFFVHSPFAVRNDDELEDKNVCSMILQASFLVDGRATRFFLCGDTDHETLSKIVEITKDHGNEDRLEWDIFDIPHHCSYLALSSEKGKTKTKPVDEVKWLLEDQAGDKVILVCCSDIIPDEDTDQPPHKQAHAYYDGVRESKDGELHVTMQHPKPDKPEPLVIKIQGTGAVVEKLIPGAAYISSQSRPPRAG
jgi:hypothetical protein